MDDFKAQLNFLLVDTFWKILKVQEQFVRRVANIDLSMSEMHMIEVIGNRNQARLESGRTQKPGCTISEIAEDLDITLPSVTSAIKKLVLKKCVDKIRCAMDGRVVYIKLTELGQEIYDRHHNFHHKMVNAMAEGLSEQERLTLIKGVTNLNAFYQNKIIQESK